MQHLPFFFSYSGLNFTIVCLNLCLSIFLCDSLGTEWALYLGFLGGASGKEPTCHGGKRSGFHPWVGKIPLEDGHGNPLQDSALENPMDRGAWQSAAHRVPQSWTRLKRLSTQENPCYSVLGNFLRKQLLNCAVNIIWAIKVVWTLTWFSTVKAKHRRLHIMAGNFLAV